MKLISFELLAHSSALVFVEKHVVGVGLHRVAFTRQHTALSIKSMGCLLVDFRSAKTEVRGWSWPRHLLISLREPGELAASALWSSCPGTVLARTMHALGLEVGLPAEGDIAFIPVESLIEPINQTIFALVGCIDWLVDPLILYLAFLLPHLLQFAFVTLKLEQLWTRLEDRVQAHLVLQGRRVHTTSLIE
jgi:hypothetical protein